jgi:hypothetical protein
LSEGVKLMPLPPRYENKLSLSLSLPYPAWLEILEILAAANAGGLAITTEQMEAGGMFADLVQHAFGQYALEHEIPRGSA